MGDRNQLTFIRKFAEHLKGPFLEVGSRDYGSTQDLRILFADRDKYIGVDMEDGTGVDIVLDLTGDFEHLDAKLHGHRFGTIFCLSVLEHCEQPFKMAENLTLLLKPRGQIVISAPFSWKIHGYPNDYWRFTPEGIKKLFPKIEFNEAFGLAATSKVDEFQKLNNEFGRISLNFNKHYRNGHILRGISAKFLKTLSHFGLLSWLTGYRYVHAPTNILMIGRLKDTQ